MILRLYKSLVRLHLNGICNTILVPKFERGKTKIEKVQRKASEMIPEIRNHSYSQRIKTSNSSALSLSCVDNWSKYSNTWNGSTMSQQNRGLFDRDFNDWTSNNGVILIAKCFHTWIGQHLYPIITTTWNALPSDIVSSRTVNMFKNPLDQHWELNPPNVRTIF